MVQAHRRLKNRWRWAQRAAISSATRAITVATTVAAPETFAHSSAMPGSEDEAANLLDAYLDAQQEQAEAAARAAGGELADVLTGEQTGEPVAYGR